MALHNCRKTPKSFVQTAKKVTKQKIVRIEGSTSSSQMPFPSAMQRVFPGKPQEERSTGRKKGRVVKNDAKEIDRKFRGQGIEIPFPRRGLHL